MDTRAVWATLGPSHDDSDLEQELRLHLERAAEDARRGADSPERAVRAARIRAGGMEQAMEALRDQRGLPWLTDLTSDLRYGVRMLAKHPGFTSVAVLSLALGIGATTTIFSVMNAALLRPLPLESPDRLVGLWSSRSRTGFGPISYPNYKDYRDQNHVFTGLAASSVARPMNLSGRGTPTQVHGMPVSGDYFSVLGVRPVPGRGFLPEEDRTPGTHPVVVISHGLWQGRFGSDPNVVGDIVVLNGQPFTVVGVALHERMGGSLRQPGGRLVSHDVGFSRHVGCRARAGRARVGRSPQARDLPGSGPSRHEHPC